MNRHFSVIKAYGGLVAAPLAWMLSVQLSQILPYIDCANRIFSAAICAAVAATVALSAAARSWRGSGGASLADGHPRRFIGSLAGLTALAISFALMLQLLASLTLNPCER
jgi:hypothetical protein